MAKAKDLTSEEFPGFCRGRGLKCTAQRLAVFAAVGGKKTHPSVDEVMAQVRKSVPTVTRDSVYRILNEFAELGILTRMDALSAARYDTWTEPHAHFICEICGAVADYPLPKGLALPKGMPKDQRHIELRVTGTCDKCRIRQSRKS